MDNARKQDLEKQIGKGAKRVRSLVKQGNNAVQGIVSGYTDNPRFPTNASLRRAMYQEIAAAYKDFGDNIDDWTKDSINGTARIFWKYAKVDMPINGTFDSFSAKYVDDIISEINPSTMGDLVGINAQAGGMLQSEIRALRAAVSTTIAEGTIEGLTNTELAERMRKKVNKAAGQFIFTDKSGRKWKAEDYFGMLNRTIHANAARKTYTAAGIDAGFDVYTIDGGYTGSSLTNPDDPCDKWQGKEFSMTGATKGLPTYDDVLAAGVFHPNCVHFIRAVTKGEK